jgi:hypothetical protein
VCVGYRLPLSNTVSNPCPCCGYLVFRDIPGSNAICPICFWEDDEVQLAYPLSEAGANAKCLYESQENFCRFGACEARFARNVRSPLPEECRACDWRRFDPANDPHLEENRPEDDERWRRASLGVNMYYWEAGYWLASRGEYAGSGSLAA